MTESEEYIRQLHALASEHGITRLERELDWPEKKFHKARGRSGGFYFHEVVRILKALGGSLLILGPGGESSVASRFLEQGRLRARARPSLLPTLRPRRTPDRLAPEDLRRLDELRFHDPAAAARQAKARAREAAREGRAADAARLMARQAAARRLLPDLEGAHACLWWALRQLPEDPDLWLRSSDIVADSGEFEDAARLAAKALLTYSDLGDLSGMARCVRQRANVFYYLGDKEKALNGFQVALHLLPQELRSQRVAVHQNLAAERHLHCAEVIEPPPGISGAKLKWLRARIARRRQRIVEADALYRETVEELAPSPADAALALCEFVQFLLETGETATAIVEAKRSARFLALARDRLVQTAVADLARSALVGERRLRIEVQRAIQRLESQERRGGRRRIAAGPARQA